MFITLEGPDGAGKSLQAERLARALRTEGQGVTVAREPGGTRLGEHIRTLLLQHDAPRTPIADALLFNSARAQLVREVIEPALGREETVICDRFADSTLAYQGFGSGLDLDMLRSLERLATGGLRPDMTILLDLPPQEGLARRTRGPASDVTRFERIDRSKAEAGAEDAGFDAAFHERVREGYLALAAQEPDRWRIVDARPDPDTVAKAVAMSLQGSPAIGEPSTTHLRMTS